MTLFHGLGPFASSLSSGDFDFITSASGTAVSSLSINNCFSAGYDHYLVTRNLLGSAADIALGVRLRVAGVDASGTDYRDQYVNATGASAPAGARATGATSWTAVGYTEATSCGFQRTWISNPFGTVRTTAWSDRSSTITGNIELTSRVYEHDLTTSYDGFTVIPASGTITGSLYVYGLAV